jgi:hypothetical protein
VLFGDGGEGMDEPDGFMMEGSRGLFRPVGSVVDNHLAKLTPEEVAWLVGMQRLKEVVQLEPKNKLSAALVKALTTGEAAPTDGPPQPGTGGRD